MKYFCIIEEKIAYMECVIQSSMFNSFYLFLSILGCNVDSALVSNSNAYILNLESCSNVRIYIRMLKECVFSTCSWKMAFSDDVGKKISQLHEELVNAYKKKLLLRGGGGGWEGGGAFCAECDVTQEKERSSLRCCCVSNNYDSCKKVVNNHELH